MERTYNEYNKLIITHFLEYFEANIELDELIKVLREVDSAIRDQLFELEGEIPYDERSIWFRFFKDDTGAHTIGEIETDLSLPASHANHKYMMDSLIIACEKGNTGFKIYYS